jgi:hypothetical protein
MALPSARCSGCAFKKSDSRVRLVSAPENDGNEIPFVVCHNVSIVDLYSYIVIVKPRKGQESWR